MCSVYCLSSLQMAYAGPNQPPTFVDLHGRSPRQRILGLRVSRE